MADGKAENEGQLELMAEDPVADIYAHALIQTAQEQGRLEAVFEALGDLLSYMDKDRQFAGFLASDSVDSDPRALTLEKLFRGRMDDILLNFLLVLNRRDRMNLIRDIYRCCELRMEAWRHQQEVTVESATPLTDVLRKTLADQVSRYIGKEALLREQVRPELLGGVVIRVGDLRIDGSVVTKIATMRKKLSNRATMEVHRGTGVG